MAEYIKQLTDVLDNLPLDTYTLFLICNIVLVLILTALLWKEGLTKVLIFIAISLGLSYGVQYLTPYLELWKSCVLVCILEILLEICIRGLKGSGATGQRPAVANGIVSYPIAVGGGSTPDGKLPQGKQVSKGNKKSYKRPENKTFSLWSKKPKEEPPVLREDINAKKQALKSESTRQEPIVPLFDMGMSEPNANSQSESKVFEESKTEFNFQTVQHNTMEIPDIMLSKSDENETEEERIRRLLDVLAEHDKERAALEFESSFGSMGNSTEDNISVNLGLKEPHTSMTPELKVQKEEPKVNPALFEALMNDETVVVEKPAVDQWSIEEPPVSELEQPEMDFETPIADTVEEVLPIQDFFVEDSTEEVVIDTEPKAETPLEDEVLQVAFDESDFYTEDEEEEVVEAVLETEKVETQQDIFSNIEPINLDKDLNNDSELTYEWELDQFNFDEKDLIDLSPINLEEDNLIQPTFEETATDEEWSELPVPAVEAETTNDMEAETVSMPISADTKDSSILWTDTIVMDDLIKEQQNIMMENEAAIINLLQGDYNDAPKIETLHSVVILMNRAATENLMKSAHELLESDVAGGANLLKQVCLCATDSELSNQAFFELMEAMPDLSLKEQEEIVDRMIAKEEMLINLMHKKNINVNRNEMEWF